MSRWGAYEDYAQEIDEEAEKEAHENYQCNEDTCVYCIEERDEAEREADEYHERYEENRRGILERK